MSEFKRKGQIVPKCLVKSIEKKAQHLVRFGCDVEMCRVKKTIVVLGEGSVFYIKNVKHVLKKKNKVTVKGFYFENVTCEIQYNHNTGVR